MTGTTSGTETTASGEPGTKAERRVTRRTGLVTSAAMTKTIVVRVERRELHPVYKKYVRRFTKLYAHDEKNEAKAGDTVDLVACRPLSKLKRWRLERIVRSGGESEAP